eukprot:CAMPEP_0115149144 /NCGR_PEP_ID=MMETSP0227-20121206/64278_1 /TAXON_ID=89957 /ORGANISM="Polarella glacialis, Strain CCMP 1383" /LENGTH=70 /DNA_ID=CAMNT_0002559281 /DNA_START=995 /DNA_END=1207 /DNA_ORIENTATION=-
MAIETIVSALRGAVRVAPAALVTAVYSAAAAPEAPDLNHPDGMQARNTSNMLLTGPVPPCRCAASRPLRH